jgi:signal transduction protein with GAF and PtsI domain
MTRSDLVRQLGELMVDLEPLAATTETAESLTAMCRAARCAFGAGAVSVAVIEEDVLRYVAADGEGAADIVGTVLPAGRGIAGYVAMSGQSLAVDHVSSDPRFAREVAERTGYVPTTILVVPVVDASNDVVGVLSVLDRNSATADALELASAFAAQAGILVPSLGQVGRTSNLLLAAVVDAVRSKERDLGGALRRSVGRLPEADADLARFGAVLADLRRLDPSVRARVMSILTDVVTLAGAGRRR